ncbi:MAG: molybdopterin-dependent oxidoreductase [Deltaproteobacteria bacterium]|nr:molybdopterin-dependent oxidoreductase [Deltaproteobacteria bacterium]
MISVTRRDFIRIATLMGGVSLFAGCNLLKEAAPVPDYIEGAPAVDPTETTEGVTNVLTVCGLCPGNCGICCRVAQGVLVKIGGNPYHPVSRSGPLPFETPLEKAAGVGGSLCAIGGSGVQTLYDPFRVARPLKRVGPRGSGKWRAISWSEAVSEIVAGGNLFAEGHVDGLRHLTTAGQGLSLLVGTVDWGALAFIKRFLGAFPGASLVRDRSVMMNQAAREAADAVFGAGTGPVDADYGRAQFVLSFGDAPLDSGVPLVSIARQIADARINGRLQWAVVDPRLSTSASKADLWVPTIPGTDVNLALGIMKALSEGHPDALKVPRGEIDALVSGRTVEDCAASCGLSPEIPRRLAELLAGAGPRSAVVAGPGIIAQPDGAERAGVILTLNPIVGSLPGAGGLAARDDTFLVQAEKRLLEGAKRDWEPKTLEGPTKALVLWAADPVYADPASTSQFLTDRSKVPLFVAISTHITETAALADYILPDTTYLERWDICQSAPSVTAPGIGVRSPVVGGFDPKAGRYFPLIAETKPMEEILIQVGAALNLPGFEADQPGSIKSAWEFHKSALTSVLTAMKDAGLPVDVSEEYLHRVVERGGVFTATPRRPADKKQTARTSISGLHSSRIGASIPTEKRADEFLLITYSLPFHRSPGSGLNSWLLEILPENRLLMNSKDARKLSIRQYEKVTVQSGDGTARTECKVQLMPGIRPGVVAFARGFGYRELGARPQTIDNITTPPDKPRGVGVNPDAIAATKGSSVVRVTKS